MEGTFSAPKLGVVISYSTGKKLAGLGESVGEQSQVVDPVGGSSV